MRKQNPPAAARNLNAPFPVSPSGGKPGRGRFPPRRKHAARQQTALASIDAAGSPHKRAAAPLCIPCERAGELQVLGAKPELSIWLKTGTFYLALTRDRPFQAPAS